MIHFLHFDVKYWNLRYLHWSLNFFKKVSCLFLMQSLLSIALFVGVPRKRVMVPKNIFFCLKSNICYLRSKIRYLKGKIRCLTGRILYLNEPFELQVKIRYLRENTSNLRDEGFVLTGMILYLKYSSRFVTSEEIFS